MSMLLVFIVEASKIKLGLGSHTMLVNNMSTMMFNDRCLSYEMEQIASDLICLKWDIIALI